MTKNLIIFVLLVFLIGALAALQHMTVRYDAAMNYIDVLETDFPDYIDVTAETDAYSDYYNY